MDELLLLGMLNRVLLFYFLYWLCWLKLFLPIH
jgi:hypothetical protein